MQKNFNLEMNGNGDDSHCEARKRRNNPAEKADGIYAGKREPKSRQRSEVMTGVSAKRFQDGRSNIFPGFLRQPQSGFLRMTPNGFTLAEVLITLVIIGVIGALTVPSLIQRTQKQEYVSALKKAYSTLSQATQEIIAEEGSPRADEGGWASSTENVYNLYKSKLNILKDCGTETGCLPQLSNGNKFYKYLSGGDDGNNWESSNYYKTILSDGIQIFFGAVKENCSEMNWVENCCAYINIDINGVKKPNQWGRDAFSFVIKENGLYPAGCNADNTYISYFGISAACKVLREGAMNY